jgi:hypothetical protein
MGAYWQKENSRWSVARPYSIRVARLSHVVWQNVGGEVPESCGEGGCCSGRLGTVLSEPVGVLSQRKNDYTVVGILEDGVGLNRAVSDLRALGIVGDDLTVILKRADPDEPEPFPDGTRYIVVPDDLRGLEIPIAFAAIFVVASLLFAFTAPGIGTMIFVFFSVMAAILAAGAFTSVGLDPILMEMEAPPEDAGAWNDAFEGGKVLLFASTTDRRILRPIWETLQRQGADFNIIERRLEPQPTSGATLRRAGEEAEGQKYVVDAREA